MLKNKMMLNPNCSEVCWRLDVISAMPIKEQIVESLNKTKITEDDFNSYGQEDDIRDIFEDMVDTIKAVKSRHLPFEHIELDFSDGGGGGGDYGAIGECYEYAMRYCKGELTKRQALKLLNIGDEND